MNGATPGGNPNRRHQYTFRLLPTDVTRLADRARRLNIDRSKLLEVLIRRGLDQLDTQFAGPSWAPDSDPEDVA
jgi:hypothetical protein